MPDTDSPSDEGSPYARFYEGRRTPPPKPIFVKCGHCQSLHYVKGVSRIGEARNLLIDSDWIIIPDTTGTLDDMWFCPACGVEVRRVLKQFVDELDERRQGEDGS